MVSTVAREWLDIRAVLRTNKKQERHEALGRVWLDVRIVNVDRY
jgi:hypothetical protein